MNLLEKLTIIIPTYNRHAFLKRQIEFWKDINTTLIILDGSDTPFLYDFEDTINLNVNYHYIPSSIEQRLEYSINLIKTPYSVLLSDDEFYIPSALRSCIMVMENDTTVSVCKGLALGFDYQFDRINGYDIYGKLKNYRINHSDPVQRLKNHLGNYTMAVLWGVTRTDVLRKMFYAIGKGPFSTAAAAEIQCSIIGAWEGKVHITNEMMWLRSFENKNVWWSFGDISFSDWVNDSRFNTEVEKFITSIITEINFFGLSKNKVKSSIACAIDKYVGSSKQKSRLSLIFNTINKKIRTFIKNILYLVFRKRMVHSFEDKLNILSREGFIINVNEVRNILEIIKNFHMNN